MIGQELDLNRLSLIANKIFRVAAALSQKKGEPMRTGGYLSVADRSEGILACIMIGIVRDPDLRHRSCFNSKEKADRLVRNKKHVSSYQSRDESVGHYGGAIWDGSLIYSFSGLPEIWDEAAMIIVAQTYPINITLTADKQEEIMKISSKDNYPRKIDLALSDHPTILQVKRWKHDEEKGYSRWSISRRDSRKLPYIDESTIQKIAVSTLGCTVDNTDSHPWHFFCSMPRGISAIRRQKFIIALERKMDISGMR
jgi:hypothetical protein